MDLLYSPRPLHMLSEFQLQDANKQNQPKCQTMECKKADEKHVPDQDVLCMHMHQLAVKGSIRRYNSQLIEQRVNAANRNVKKTNEISSNFDKS